jgi:hypothetical protein
VLFRSNWLQPPNKHYDLPLEKLKYKYIDAMSYNNELDTFAFGTSHGDLALYKINKYNNLSKKNHMNRIFSVKFNEDKKINLAITNINFIKDKDKRYLIASNVEKETRIYSFKNDNSYSYSNIITWSDTTVYESISNNIYYRINYFGDIKMYYIYDTKVIIKNHKLFTDNKLHLQVAIINDNKLFVITEDNVIHVYDLNDNFKEVFKLKINQEIDNNFLIYARDIHILKKTNTYFVMIGYHSESNGIISGNIITLVVMNTSSVYSLIKFISAKHNKPIIKLNINHNLLLILDSESYMTCYKLCSFNNIPQLTYQYSMYLNHEYTTNFICTKNHILLNGFRHVKVLDYNSVQNDQPPEDDTNMVLSTS